MKLAYVVTILTGEYDDTSEVPVKVFLDEEKAKTFVSKANNWLIEHHLHYQTPHAQQPTHSERSKLSDTNPFGPDYISYSGAEYIYYSLPLED